MDATATVPERRAQKGAEMIDRTTFDLRIAEHGTTAARVIEADWQRRTAAGSTDPATVRGARQRGRFALRARLATAATILGCATALTFGGLHAASETPDQPATGPAGARGAHSIWTGTCRAGGVDCLPDEDYAASAATVGVATADWATILLIEQNTLPEIAARAGTAQK